MFSNFIFGLQSASYKESDLKGGLTTFQPCPCGAGALARVPAPATLTWGQPPEPALSEVEGAVQPSKARQM